MSGCIELWIILKLSLIPAFMHPDTVSGIEIATKLTLGTESSLLSNEMVQYLFKQVNE